MAGTLFAPKKTAPGASPGLTERRRARWPIYVAWILFAVVVGNLLAVITSVDALPIIITPAGVFLAAYVAYSGVLNNVREETIDKLVEAVTPLLGDRGNRNLVQAKKWKGRWPGVPQLVKFRYLGGIDHSDSSWVGELRKKLELRLGTSYGVAAHHPRKCIIVFAPWEEPEEAPIALVEQRARDVAKELLGSPGMADPAVTVDLKDDVLNRIEVKHGMGVKVSKPIYRYHIEKTFSQMVPGRWRAYWDLEQDTVRFEIRPVLKDRVLHPLMPVVESAIAAYSTTEFTYGVDEDGHEMKWAPKDNPHFLVTGTSGSGKTVLVRGVATEAAWYGWEVFINDAKLIEFMGLEGWPNVRMVAASMEEQVRVIHWACDLMEERYAAIRNRQAKKGSFQPVLIVLDEFADFREQIVDWYSELMEKSANAKMIAALKRVRSLARKARTAQVHMVVSLQRPDAEFLTGEVRDNFSARASMGRLSPNGALMMWENAATGVALPRKSKGLGVTLNENSEPVEFRAYFTPDPEDLEDLPEDELRLLEQLRPAKVTHERLMMIPPKADESTGSPKKPTYDQIANAPLVAFDAELYEQIRPTLVVIQGDADSDESGAEPRGKAALRIVESREAPLEEDDDLDADYEEMVSGSPESLEPGFLVLVDDQFGIWGVVEEVSEDLLDDDGLCIDYRTDDGDPGSLSVRLDDSVSYRRPIDPVDQREAERVVKEYRAYKKDKS